MHVPSFTISSGVSPAAIVPFSVSLTGFAGVAFKVSADFNAYPSIADLFLSGMFTVDIISPDEIFPRALIRGSWIESG